MFLANLSNRGNLSTLLGFLINLSSHNKLRRFLLFLMNLSSRGNYLRKSAGDRISSIQSMYSLNTCNFAHNLLKSMTLFWCRSMVWNSMSRIVITIYLIILTIYKTRMVMQCGHARTTLTSLQSRALTMLSKHNNLNKMKQLKRMTKKYGYSAKMSTISSDNSSSEEEDEDESDGEESCSLTNEQIRKTKPCDTCAVDTSAT
jgi:hypothetical protein